MSPSLKMPWDLNPDGRFRVENIAGVTLTFPGKDAPLLQHSALHDYYPQRRLMERVTIGGARPINAFPAADPSEVRRYLMPPVMSFDESRQKRQHEL